MAKIELDGRLGLVSNCWNNQLAEGASLAALVQQAAEEGFRFVELRQGCLGECEDSESRLPFADSLRQLAQSCPEVTFNLAVELAVFSERIDVNSKTVETMLQSACALAENGHPAHLRIVDLVSKIVPAECSIDDETSSSLSLQNVVETLASLKAKLPGGIVSVEHSFQPWAGVQKLFETANATAPMLQFCYDPCNFWLAGDGEEVNEITAGLPIDWLSMVHLKQRVENSVTPRLEPGRLDWSKQLGLLARAGYSGPFLFETAPDENVWDRLRESRDYLEAVISELQSC